MTQQEFSFDHTKSISKECDNDDVTRDVITLCYYLYHCNGHGWRTAWELFLIFQWTDRYCRILAHASKGQIISGNRGYKATTKATPEEVLECTRRLAAQARKMFGRVTEINQVSIANNQKGRAE